LEAGGVLSSGLITVPVSLGPTSQSQFYSGKVPQLPDPLPHHIRRAWGAVTGMSGGSLEGWWKDLLNRMIQRNLFDLRPHFIPSFRQITTKLPEFYTEFAVQSGDKHLIDQLAELAHPSYDEQDKKLQFEKLRKFIGGIINDPNVSIEIPSNRMTINVRSGDNFLPIEALGSGKAHKAPLTEGGERRWGLFLDVGRSRNRKLL
jgi:hypothetical protein